MSESAVTSFFVYGTLKRGQCREHLWPKTPVKIRNAWVAGELYDREDYPAMKAGTDRVQGELWTFEPTEIGHVIQVLDQIECTNGNSPTDLYHRHEIESVCETTGDPILAIAYFYVRNPMTDGFVRIEPDETGSVHWPPQSR